MLVYHLQKRDMFIGVLWILERNWIAYQRVWEGMGREVLEVTDIGPCARPVCIELALPYHSHVSYYELNLDHAKSLFVTGFFLSHKT